MRRGSFGLSCLVALVGFSGCLTADRGASPEEDPRVQGLTGRHDEGEPTRTQAGQPAQPRLHASLGEAGGFVDDRAEEPSPSSSPAPAPSPEPGWGFAGDTGRLGGAGVTAGAPVAPPARPTGPMRSRPSGGSSHGAAPLPQSGVLANTFTGGRGMQARLDDLLERGVMIDGEQVRIEAFQDRGRLPYAVPREEAVALYTELERTKMHAGGDTVHLQIALLARQGEAPVRPRVDVRLVIDRSGSMADADKWPNAVAAAHALVNALEQGDTFGLISYSEDASLDVSPTEVRDGADIHRAIDRLRPGGGTNIGAALDLAAAHRPRRRAPSDLGMVVLLSDGMATVGVTDARALGASARRMFDEDGVLTTAVGLGTAFDEQTMLTIAREGSGSYHFVRRAADIQQILEDELEDRVQAVAQALRVRVVLGRGVVARKVYGTRLLSENEHAQVRATEVATDQRIARELGIGRDRQREAEEGLRIHLPTFRRGDQHVILMELDVPGGRAGSTAGVARVFLDYKDLGRRRNGEAEHVVVANRVGDRDETMASVQRTVKRTVLSFQAGEALQLAARALDGQDAMAAAALLAERRELLEAASDVWRDPSLRRDATLLRRYEQVLSRVWDRFGHDERRTLVMAMSYYGDQRMR